MKYKHETIQKLEAVINKLASVERGVSTTQLSASEVVNRMNLLKKDVENVISLIELE